MQLHYRTLGEAAPDRPPIIILHGIFGTSDNWQTFGKALSEQYQIFLVDQRNHGQSPHSEQFDYPAMADDLQEFVATHDLVQPVVLGHSMGGKTAMFFATQYPDRLSKLIIVDIAPRAYPVHHQAVLDAFAAVDIEHLESRQQAQEAMKPHVAEPGVQQFLLKNLKRTDDGFAWKLNLSTIRDNIENVGVAVPDDNTFDRPTLFVRGAKSNYIQDEDQDLIKRIFPKAQLKTVTNAGHWVHAEQPEALLKIVAEFLSE